MMKQVYLLMGRPGSGKTSLVRQAVAGLTDRAGGFYTEEIRRQGERRGFKLVTLAGEEAVLADVRLDSRYRVGKYGVDINALERVGVAALQQAIQGCSLVVVDEIGKMELLSNSFKKTVLEAIDGGKRVLGTIMFSPHRWADAIKRRPEVFVAPVTGANRQQVLAGLQQWLEVSDNG
jgi:nucleoside-triphosphatase